MYNHLSPYLHEPTWNLAHGIFFFVPSEGLRVSPCLLDFGFLVQALVSCENLHVFQFSEYLQIPVFKNSRQICVPPGLLDGVVFRSLLFPLSCGRPRVAPGVEGKLTAPSRRDDSVPCAGAAGEGDIDLPLLVRPCRLS